MCISSYKNNTTGPPTGRRMREQGQTLLKYTNTNKTKKPTQKKSGPPTGRRLPEISKTHTNSNGNKRSRTFNTMRVTANTIYNQKQKEE